MSTRRWAHGGWMAGLLLVMAQTSSASLVGYYPMNETVNPSLGTSIADASGNSRNGTVYSDATGTGPIVGVASANAGLYGTAYDFPAAQTDENYGYISGYGTLLTRDTALTYAAWIKPSATQIATGAAFIATNGNGYSFLLSPSGSDWALKLAGYNPPQPTLTSTLATLPSDVWTHVAVTKDANGSAGTDLANVTFYINGVAMESGTIGRSAGSPSSGRVAGIVLGANAISGYYQGGLDEVRIYDEVLDANAIAALAVVPEPSAAILAMVGLAGLVARRFTRQFYGNRIQ